MKSLSCLALLFASILLFNLAQATQAQQLSIYAAPAVTDFGFTTNGTNFVKSDTGGFIVGGFYNFPIESRLTAGIDLHASHGFGQRGGTSGAVSLRVGFVPNHVVLRPYFQIGAAVVSSTDTDLVYNPLLPSVIPQPVNHVNAALEFAAGLDVRLSRSFDLRALEIGAAAGGSSNSSTTDAGTAFVDAGIVYHFQKHP